MAEVTSAVIATSLVLISVFVPVSFFPGHDRHSVQAVLADDRVLHRDLGVQCADAFTGAGCYPAARDKQLLPKFFGPVGRLFEKPVGWFESGLKKLIAAYATAVTVRGALALCDARAVRRRHLAQRRTCIRMFPRRSCRRKTRATSSSGATPPGASLSYTTELADARQRRSSGRTMMSSRTFSVMGFGSPVDLAELGPDLRSAEAASMSARRRAPA